MVKDFALAPVKPGDEGEARNNDVASPLPKRTRYSGSYVEHANFDQSRIAELGDPDEESIGGQNPSESK